MKAESSEGIWFVCPRCGASNLPDSEACFICGRRADAPGSAPAPAPAPAPRAPTAAIANPYAPPAHRQSEGRGFHIDSMLLVIAVIAVCLGVIHEAPGLGIPLAIVSFIALARTAIRTSGTPTGQPLSIWDKAAVFFASIGIVLIVLFCVFIAFFATCLAIIFVLTPGNGQVFSLPVAISIPIFLILAAAVVWVLMSSFGRLARVRSAPWGRSGQDPEKPGSSPLD